MVGVGGAAEGGGERGGACTAGGHSGCSCRQAAAPRQGGGHEGGAYLGTRTHQGGGKARWRLIAEAKGIETERPKGLIPLADATLCKHVQCKSERPVPAEPVDWKSKRR